MEVIIWWFEFFPLPHFEMLYNLDSNKGQKSSVYFED